MKIVSYIFIVLCGLCLLWGLFDAIAFNKVFGLVIVLLNGLAIALNVMNLLRG